MMTIFRRPVLQVALYGAVYDSAEYIASHGTRSDCAARRIRLVHQHGGHDQGQREEHQIAFLTKKLNLTPDQVIQVKAIDDDARQQMMALRNDTATPKADKRAKMMDIHKASQDKIRAVLTDDQKTKYDALQAEMREHRESREGGQGAPPASASSSNIGQSQEVQEGRRSPDPPAFLRRRPPSGTGAVTMKNSDYGAPYLLQIGLPAGQRKRLRTNSKGSSEE